MSRFIALAVLLVCSFTLISCSDPREIDKEAGKELNKPNVRINGKVSQAVLRPPAQFKVAVKYDELSNKSCPKLITPFVGNLVFKSKYEGSDSSRSKLNPKAEAAYRLATQSVRELEQTLSQLSDSYVQAKQSNAGLCVIQQLAAWAERGALSSAETNHTGKAVRKWFMAAAGLAYLKVKQADLTLGDDLSQAQVVPLAKDFALVETWMHSLAMMIKKDYSDRPRLKVNNHDYWAAMSVMVAAINTQDRELYDWSLGKYQEALSQVDGVGFLPNELKRKKRALEYHNYAMQPLSMMTLFAEANNPNFISQLGEHEDALLRLVNLTVKGIADPRTFKQATDKEQGISKVLTAYGLAWLVPLQAVNAESFQASLVMPNKLLSEVDQLSPLKSSRLGGDLAWLFANSTRLK